MWYWYLYGSLAVCVALDAARRRTNGFAWGTGTLLFGPIVFPVYLAKRPLRPGEIRKGGTGWNILRNFALSWSLPMIPLTAFIAAVLTTANRLLEIYNPSADRFIGVILGIGLTGTLWILPAATAILLGLCLRDSSAVERMP